MTRGKWVALAVGLAVIAVLVLNGPVLWKAVRYEGVRFYEFNYQVRDDTEPTRQPEYIVVLRKRFKWMSGYDVIEPRCSWCVEENHSMCARVMESPEGVPAEDEVFWRCTCPHPSHAQDSE